MDRVAAKARNVRKVIQTLIVSDTSFGEIEVLHPAGVLLREDYGSGEMP